MKRYPLSHGPQGVAQQAWSGVLKLFQSFAQCLKHEEGSSHAMSVRTEPLLPNELPYWGLAGNKGI